MPSEVSICSPEALFINTGKMAINADSEGHNEHKFNEFVVYDEAQVKMRYLIRYRYKAVSN